MKIVNEHLLANSNDIFLLTWEKFLVQLNLIMSLALETPATNQTKPQSTAAAAAKNVSTADDSKTRQSEPSGKFALAISDPSN